MVGPRIWHDTGVSEAPAAAGLTIGATVGNYRIQEKIGEGGMGAVYLATHPLLGRKAAVKMLLPEHSKKADLVTRFFNEAKTAASLRHPALVEVFDFGFLPDGPGLHRHGLPGGREPQRRLTRVAPLAPEVAAEIARQLAAGVAAAHSQGIVHRDLKPDNIFLVPDPEQPDRERVKILDFGIAKLVLPSTVGSKGATSTGMLLGTPLFMAPEQCRGAGTVDHRADIYSVGCILYNMLTAHPPFDREGVGEILAAHLHEQVTPPRALDPSLPEALEAIVMRALSKRPEDRQQSMADLAGELQGFLYPGGVPGVTGQLPRPSTQRAAAPPASRASAPAVPVAASPVQPERTAALPRDNRREPAPPVAAGGRTGVYILLALLVAGGAAGGGAYLMFGKRGARPGGRRPAAVAQPTVATPAAPPTTPTPPPMEAPTPTPTQAVPAEESPSPPSRWLPARPNPRPPPRTNPRPPPRLNPRRPPLNRRPPPRPPRRDRPPPAALPVQSAPARSGGRDLVPSPWTGRWSNARAATKRERYAAWSRRSPAAPCPATNAARSIGNCSSCARSSASST